MAGSCRSVQTRTTPPPDREVCGRPAASPHRRVDAGRVGRDREVLVREGPWRPCVHTTEFDERPSSLAEFAAHVIVAAVHPVRCAGAWRGRMASSGPSESRWTSTVRTRGPTPRNPSRVGSVGGRGEQSPSSTRHLRFDWIGGTEEGEQQEQARQPANWVPPVQRECKIRFQSALG